MSKDCGSECARTGSLDKSGKRQMIAQKGNRKFPAGQLHPQCDECIKEMIEEGELMILFNNDRALTERYKELMKSKK